MVSPYNAFVVTRKRCLFLLADVALGQIQGWWAEGLDSSLYSFSSARYSWAVHTLHNHTCDSRSSFPTPNLYLLPLIYFASKPETWASSLMPPISSPFISRLLIISTPFMLSLLLIPKFSGFTSCLHYYGRFHLASTIHSRLLSCVFHQETGDLSKMPTWSHSPSGFYHLVRR